MGPQVTQPEQPVAPVEEANASEANSRFVDLRVYLANTRSQCAAKEHDSCAAKEHDSCAAESVWSLDERPFDVVLAEIARRHESYRNFDSAWSWTEDGNEAREYARA